MNGSAMRETGLLSLPAADPGSAVASGVRGWLPVALLVVNGWYWIRR